MGQVIDRCQHCQKADAVLKEAHETIVEPLSPLQMSGKDRNGVGNQVSRSVSLNLTIDEHKVREMEPFALSGSVGSVSSEDERIPVPPMPTEEDLTVIEDLHSRGFLHTDEIETKQVEDGSAIGKQSDMEILPASEGKENEDEIAEGPSSSSKKNEDHTTNIPISASIGNNQVDESLTLLAEDTAAHDSMDENTVNERVELKEAPQDPEVMTTSPMEEASIETSASGKDRAEETPTPKEVTQEHDSTANTLTEEHSIEISSNESNPAEEKADLKEPVQQSQGLVEDLVEDLVEEASLETSSREMDPVEEKNKSTETLQEPEAKTNDTIDEESFDTSSRKSDPDRGEERAIEALHLSLQVLEDVASVPREESPIPWIDTEQVEDDTISVETSATGMDRAEETPAPNEVTQEHESTANTPTEEHSIEISSNESNPVEEKADLNEAMQQSQGVVEEASLETSSREMDPIEEKHKSTETLQEPEAQTNDPMEEEESFDTSSRKSDPDRGEERAIEALQVPEPSLTMGLMNGTISSEQDPVKERIQPKQSLQVLEDVARGPGPREESPIPLISKMEQVEDETAKPKVIGLSQSKTQSYSIYGLCEIDYIRDTAASTIHVPTGTGTSPQEQKHSRKLDLSYNGNPTLAMVQTPKYAILEVHR